MLFCDGRILSLYVVYVPPPPEFISVNNQLAKNNSKRKQELNVGMDRLYYTGSPLTAAGQDGVMFWDDKWLLQGPDLY